MVKLKDGIQLIQSWQVVEQDAFSGFEETITELEIYKNIWITQLPTGLLRGLVNVRTLDITYNGITNLLFLNGE